MKLSRLLPILLAAAVTMPSGATVLNPAARIMLAAGQSPHASRADSDTFVPLILEIDPGTDLGALTDGGAVIFNRRDEFVLACIPRDMLGQLDEFNFIRRASLGLRANALLDRATAATGVTAVHESVATPFTGAGVVVGLTDIGFDHNHPVFKGRVGAVSHYDEQSASAVTASDPDIIAALATDHTSTYHATHVASIMTGDGDGTPYGGVAPGATLFASTSSLSDVGILAGVEDIIGFAAATGRPAVINMSVGTIIGPRDGTDIFCRYLDRCAAEVPILLSAGNDGEADLTVRHTFTDGEPTVRAIVSDRIDWSYMQLKGYCDAWSADGRPFDVSLSVFDITEKKFVYESDVVTGTFVLDSADDDAFGRYFKGRVIAASELDNRNNRHNTLLHLDLECTETRPGTGWARYYLCIGLKGAPGAHVDLSADGNTLGLTPPGGLGDIARSGDSSLSISSMACGMNTIAVGSATTRDSAPLLSGGICSWASHVTSGTVSRFSSYGSLPDGRSLPHFCAPGAYVISAASHPFLQENPEAMNMVNAAGVSPDSYFIGECGTSMASPHAAGIFALWLEADPTLTPAELREIAMLTASDNGIDPADPRCGAGLIDAEAGLREVMRRAGVTSPEMPDTDTPATYYNLQGIRVDEPLAPGIYICRRGSSTTKIAVRAR